MKFFLCGTCGRHVKECSASCPFCGGAFGDKACLDTSKRVAQLARAALVIAGSTATVMGCSSAVYGGPFACPEAVDLDSPCGFESVTTTCGDTNVMCTGAFCVVPVHTSGPCVISVRLGDGTSHAVAVTWQKPEPNQCTNALIPNPQVVGFSSATCTTLPDAGTDSPSDGPVADVGADQQLDVADGDGAAPD